MPMLCPVSRGQQFAHQPGNVARFGQVDAVFVESVGDPVGSNRRQAAADPRPVAQAFIVIRLTGVCRHSVRAKRLIGDGHQLPAVECSV